jgi:hypothetical protein
MNPSRVSLKGSSVVTGDIIFTNGNGAVYQDKGVRFNGKVVGGKLEPAN